ncbi:MAG: hypothetical protein AAFV53_06450 [Myxococcota bacterium]
MYSILHDFRGLHAPPVHFDLGGGLWFCGAIARFVYQQEQTWILVDLDGFDLAFPIDAGHHRRVRTVWLTTETAKKVSRLRNLMPEQCDGESEFLRPDAPRHSGDLAKIVRKLPHPPVLEPKVSQTQRAKRTRQLAATEDNAALRALASECINDGLVDLYRQCVEKLSADQRAHLISPKMVARVFEENRPRHLELLAAYGADIQRCGGIGRLLGEAISRGQADLVIAALRAGMDAWLRTGPAAGMLKLATKEGFHEIVAALIAAGATIPDGEHAAFGMAAVACGEPRVLRHLLDAGLDIHATDEAGRPTAHALLSIGTRPGMHAMLMAAGATFDVVYADGSTPLCCVARSGYTQPAHWIIASGAPLNAGRIDGRNPLAIARAQGERAKWVAKALEEAGAIAVEDRAVAARADQARAEAIARMRAEAEARVPAYRKQIDADAVPRQADVYAIGADDVRGHLPDGVEIERETIRIRSVAEPTSRPTVLVSAGAMEGLFINDLGERWGLSYEGLGADQIALLRAKLTHLFGQPGGATDDYKITMAYWIEIRVDDVQILATIEDWKARRIDAGYFHDDASVRQVRIADAALWALLTWAPLADFRATFRFDAYAGVGYGCRGGEPYADLPGD